jgi:error-prone DNA polymerase
MLPAYAELHCLSNFTFLQGASHPEELVERAHELGYAALALTDECSLAGVVRAHLQARRTGLKLIIGAQFRTDEIFGRTGARLVLLAQTRRGYGSLSELITRTRMRCPKGHYRLLAEDLDPALPDCIVLWVPDRREPAEIVCSQVRWLGERYPGRLWLAVELLSRGDDAQVLARCRAVSRETAVPLVAAGDVQFHVRSRKSLQDTLTAIRLNRTVDALGAQIPPNAEQHLRSRLRLGMCYPAALLEQTLQVAARCDFSLEELRYEYPDEIVPAGHSPASWLRTLTLQGAATRYPEGLPAAVARQLEHELALIAQLRYEPYFLTVADIVGFARGRGILCQGRGSAANSAVCYCLGITEVDPARMSVLFERFISRERDEPPDIDVDFEHQRREEVIQYLYRKYGRHRAALTATVVSYRPRSAMREVGKALGIDAQRLDALARVQAGWEEGRFSAQALQAHRMDPHAPVVQQWVALTNALTGFPRHLSQHTGGFVIARDRLSQLVPLENAAMAGRSVIQWDKDDLDALGLLKVDILALGMLSAIRRALELISQRRAPWRSLPMRIQDIPAEDAQTYAMIARADTVGVFQIESRAQMSMLPKLRPRQFYDLVIEVAIVRPGPIQGGMVHPYLRRRQGLEPVLYPREEIRPALQRTLGVPIFQEQVMQIAMLAAGFSAGQADELRRAMAAWRRKGGLEPFQDRLIQGMLARGYERAFAEQLFRQIQGFGEYGFPESHAASFALLVYVSSWIKCHEPAAFLAALLDSQPMGFYAPAQLVRDARRHGVQVLGVDVLLSQWCCTLQEQEQEPELEPGNEPGNEPAPDPQAAQAAAGATPVFERGVDPRPQPAVRLGLNQVRGLAQAAAQRLLQARAERQRQRGALQPAFDDVEDLARCAALDQAALKALADANALVQLAGHRASAHWEVAAITPVPALLSQTRVEEPPVVLPAPEEGREIIADYRSLGIPMGRHPLALLRKALSRYGVRCACELKDYPDGRIARASGLVTHRQRPETARGTIFVTLEDETGCVNVVIWPDLARIYRSQILGAALMTVYGIWQRDAHTDGAVTHLIAKRVVDHSALLGRLRTASRDFR